MAIIKYTLATRLTRLNGSTIVIIRHLCPRQTIVLNIKLSQIAIEVCDQPTAAQVSLFHGLTQFLMRVISSEIFQKFSLPFSFQQTAAQVTFYWPCKDSSWLFGDNVVILVLASASASAVKIRARFGQSLNNARSSLRSRIGCTCRAWRRCIALTWLLRIYNFPWFFHVYFVVRDTACPSCQRCASIPYAARRRQWHGGRVLKRERYGGGE